MNNMTGKVYLQTLKTKCTSLKDQISKLQGELAGVEFAIHEYEGKNGAILAANENPSAKKQRIPIKYDVLSYLQAAATKGLNADEVVAQSKSKFDRASVSSLLSRLKADGITTLVNDRYYLVECSPKQGASQIPAGSVLN